MGNVIKVQFSHFGSIWTNISETVHVMSDQCLYEIHVWNRRLLIYL